MIYQAKPETVIVAAQEAARRLERAIRDSPGLFASVYGSSDALDAILQSWREQGVPLNNIYVVSASYIPGADAAYERSADAILLSDAFVSTARAERLVDAIVEELGHRLDAGLGGDTPGDEGQALVAALRGEPSSVTEEDLSDETGLEYTTTVSDSGGFEGSSLTLPLESTAGSTITYSYEHYTIPDRFIIRYDGVYIVDTGFTGGRKSGTVNLPAGKSDSVEVIVVTDNAGTAWLYTVSADPLDLDCDDVRPWTITADNDFKKNDNTGKCETDGTIYVGRTDGAAPLIRVLSTSSAAYKKGLLEVKGGQIFSGIGGIVERLFTADFDLNLINGIASLSNIKQGDFKLAGLPVEFNSMSLLSDTLAFDVRFQMPDAASGLLVETVNIYNQALQIKRGGAFQFRGTRINPPGSKTFKLGGFIDVKASNMAIEYRAGEDALRFQAKVEFENTTFAKTKKGLGKVEADLSGANYIQVNTDGDVDIIGVLKATTGINLIKGWSITGLELSINTTTREVGGAGTLGTPFGVKFGEGAEARAEVEFVYDPFELDKVGLILDNINKPIPAYPAFFFQRIGGSVDNFAPSNNKDVEGKFTIGATLGPKIAGNSLALAQFDATVTSKFLEGQLTTDLLTTDFSLQTPLLTIDLGKFTLVKDVSTAKLDWSKGELSLTGTSNVLDGFVVTTGSFKANSNFDFGFARSAQVSLPNFLPAYGGTKLANSNFAINYTNNSTFADDYAAGWGTYNLVTPFDQYDITLGLRINFDGSINRIGTGNIPKTSSWFVTGGSEYVMLTAMWETATQDVKVRVIKPDGTVIDEADFATNRIAIVDDFSSDTSRTVIIDAPEEGTWDLEIVDTTGLGKISYEATGAVEIPEFNFTGTPVVNADGTVTYSFDYSFDAKATTPTYITYYYDDNLTELDGLLAGSVALNPSDRSGTFKWDAAQVVPGSYYLYAMVDSGSAPIVIVENPNAVTVGSEADLSVTFEADMEEANAGDTVQLTISVANLSAATDAKGAKAYVNLDPAMGFISSSSPLQPSDFAEFEIDLGDIEAGKTQTATINVFVNAGASSGDQIAADVYVHAETYDSVTENDREVVQFIVAEPALALVDLTVDSKINQAIAPTVNSAFTYTVTVSNKGTTNATGVVLTETVQGSTSISTTLPSFFNGNELVVQVGDLAAGTSVDVAITALASASGTIFTTSEIFADGVDSTIIDNEQINIAEIFGSNPDTVDLSLTLAPGPPLSNTITLSIQNDGPGSASNVEVQLNLPAGAFVTSSTSPQGTYDNATGIWSVGNMRDGLTRSLSLAVSGLAGGEITAEVIAVDEIDADSIPDDGQGDDFASLSGVFTPLSGTITGTPDDDILNAADTDDTIDALAGDDVVRPGGGIDVVTLGTGADQMLGSPAELNGDTVTDLELSDTLVFNSVSFDKDDVMLAPGTPTVLQVDTDDDGLTNTTISLDDQPGDDVYVWQRGSDTRLAFQNYLANVQEGKALVSGDVNGIPNTDILTGDGTRSFRVTMDPRATAAFSNSLGVYEIDQTGFIQDVRILLNDVGEARQPDLITGVDDGHTLGFFIIADGKSTADTLTNTDVLTFQDENNAPGNVDARAPLFFAVNGAMQSLNVFHSHAAALNPDGVQHAISGLSFNGKNLIIGFEDIFGGGDQDYQDVLFLVDTLL